MFTAILLVCNMGGTDCFAVGGPVFNTEEECVSSIQITGISYVLENYPEHLPVDYDCVYWSILEENT